jgi:hypothetical protein
MTFLVQVCSVGRQLFRTAWGCLCWLNQTRRSALWD